MYKRIAILGSSSVEYATNKPAAYVFNASGNNLGNFLFRYALESLLENHQLNTFALSDDPWQVSLDNDVVVVPSANQLNSRFDLAGWAKFFEKCELPILVIGVGAQAESEESTAIELKPGTQRYFDVLKERGAKILVRGSYTQECLARIGITSTEVFGCPSNLINGRRDLGQQIEERLSRAPTRLIVASCEIGSGEISVQMEKRLIQACQEGVGAYTIQGPLKAFAAKWQGDRESFAEYFGQLTDSPDDLFDRSLVFASAAQWLTACGLFTHSVGMRIHGALAALQAGVPAVCVVHDARTSELARTMRIPHVPLKRAAQMDVTEILEDAAASFSGEAYDRYRVDQMEILRRAFAEVDVDLAIGGVPLDFDWKQYLANNAHLGKSGIDTEEGALRHWIAVGRVNKRRYR